MALVVLDAMAANLQVPRTLNYYDIPRAAARGAYSPLDGEDAIHEADYERFQAIRRARHGTLAWWWLQRNYRTAGDGEWTFEIVAPELAPAASPVPHTPPPAPIHWLTPP
jgi:hypothetical protein